MKFISIFLNSFVFWGLSATARLRCGTEATLTQKLGSRLAAKYRACFIGMCFKKIPFLALLFCATVGQAAWAQAIASTHCSQDEKIVFSCAFKNKKTVSLCASADLTKKTGTLQYRYGALGKTLELQFPNDGQMLRAKSHHPSKFFRAYFDEKDKSRRGIGFMVNGFDYSIDYEKLFDEHVLSVLEYQAYADRGSNQIQAKFVCLKNKTIDNLIDLKSIEISWSTKYVY